MNIETLRIFCDVVQHQSFSRGAKINDVSQSAATQSVHRVEEHFGVQLVDRSKRPFVLTPEGPGVLRGLPRGVGTVRLGRGPGAVAADGDWRAGAGGGDLFRRPARHEPLHAGFHAAVSQGQGAAGVSAAEQGLRRRAQRRGRSGHRLLSGGLARSERDSPAIGTHGGGLPAGASADQAATR